MPRTSSPGAPGGAVPWFLRRRTLVLIGVVIVLGLAAWVLFAAVSAQRHLSAARDQVRAVDLGAPLAQISTPLRKAQRDADAADALMRQPGPSLAARVPFFGRSLAAERDVARAGAEALDAANRVIPLVQALPAKPGGVDLASLQALSVELHRSADRLRAPLARLAATKTSSVPGPVHRGVTDARDVLTGLDVTLDRAGDGADGLNGLLGANGPRTVVLALMNNAELRGAGGYASSIAVMTTDKGQIQVGPLQDTNAFQDLPAKVRTVPAPADYTRRWGPFLANSTLWKNVLMSADGPSSAAVTCAVAKLAPGIPCDGVILLDVRTLSALTALSGPVKLPDGTSAAGDNLLKALLVDSYVDAGNNWNAQVARRAALRGAADKALKEVLGSPAGVTRQLKVLADAAAGRHIMVWSAKPDEQADLVRAGVAGSVDPQGRDLSLVAFNQFSISKLDYYVSRHVGLTAVVGDTSAVVTQTVGLTLKVPAGQPSIVTGHFDEHLRGLLDIAVAPQAHVRSVSLNGAPVAYTLDQEDGSTRVVVQPDVANASTATYTVSYDVPVRDGGYAVTFLPQPLAHDAALVVSVTPAEGFRLQGGPVSRHGPFTRTQTVSVTAVKD